MDSKQKKRVLFIVLELICAAVFIFSASQLISYYISYKTSDDLYDQIIQEAMTPQSSQEETSSEVSSAVSSTVSSPAATTSSKKVSKPKPSYNFNPNNVNFDVLKKINSETIGWIYSAKTKINYPVVQSTNNDKYLKTLFDGRRNPNGAVFADYRCKSDLSGENLILYAHHMKSGSLFGSLTKYKKQSYYNKHKTFIYVDPSGKYNVDIFAGRVIHASEHTAYPLSFSGEESFNKFITETLSKSTFKSGITPKYGEKLITLSTCSYEFDNARYVLYGRIIPNS